MLIWESVLVVVTLEVTSVAPVLTSVLALDAFDVLSTVSLPMVASPSGVAMPGMISFNFSCYLILISFCIHEHDVPSLKIPLFPYRFL